MNAPAHTPTPWKTTMVCVSGRGKNSTFRPWIITPDGDRGICEVFVSGNDGRNITAEDRANAAFIVRAVNTHEDLLAGLKEMVSVFWGDSEQKHRESFRRDYPTHPVVKAEISIAEAEGR